MKAQWNWAQFYYAQKKRTVRKFDLLFPVKWLNGMIKGKTGTPQSNNQTRTVSFFKDRFPITCNSFATKFPNQFVSKIIKYIFDWKRNNTFHKRKNLCMIFLFFSFCFFLFMTIHCNCNNSRTKSIIKIRHNWLFVLYMYMCIFGSHVL